MKQNKIQNIKLVSIGSALLSAGLLSVSSTANAQGPDLVISSFQRDHASVVVNQPLKITTWLRNIGNREASPTRLGIRVGGSSTLRYSNVPSLQPGESSGPYTISGLTFSTPHTYTITAIADADKSLPELNETNNSRAMSGIKVTNAGRPNLYIGNITLSKSDPQIGDNVMVTVSVRNKLNSGVAPASKLAVKIGGETNPRIFNVASLAPGQMRSFKRSFKCTRNINLRISARADYQNLIAESRENDNLKRRDITCGGKPDLVITSVTATHKRRHLRAPFRIHVTVKNMGKAKARNSLLEIIGPCDTAPGIACGHYPTYTKNVSSLMPGESKTYNFKITYRWSLGHHTLNVTADARNAVIESNEGNNTSSITVRNR